MFTYDPFYFWKVSSKVPSFRTLVICVFLFSASLGEALSILLIFQRINFWFNWPSLFFLYCCINICSNHYFPSASFRFSLLFFFCSKSRLWICNLFCIGIYNYKYPSKHCFSWSPVILCINKTYHSYHASLGGLQFESPNSIRHRPHKFTASQSFTGSEGPPAPPVSLVSLCFLLYSSKAVFLLWT